MLAQLIIVDGVRYFRFLKEDVRDLVKGRARCRPDSRWPRADDSYFEML